MKHTQYVQNFVTASISNGVLMTFPLLVGISLLVRFPDHQITYIHMQKMILLLCRIIIIRWSMIADDQHISGFYSGVYGFVESLILI